MGPGKASLFLVMIGNSRCFAVRYMQMPTINCQWNAILWYGKPLTGAAAAAAALLVALLLCCTVRQQPTAAWLPRTEGKESRLRCCRHMPAPSLWGGGRSGSAARLMWNYLFISANEERVEPCVRPDSVGKVPQCHSEPPESQRLRLTLPVQNSVSGLSPADSARPGALRHCTANALYFY